MPMPFGWFGVSYSDELAISESRAIHYFNKELVLFRTEGGKAVVLDAYCPHLGAHLGHGINAEHGEGGRIQGETIVCPFHAWRFDEDGKCAEVPYAKNIPPKVKDKQCLYSYPVRELNQCIYIWYHPEKKEPDWEVIRIDELNDNEEWGVLDKYQWLAKTHIQEIGENGADPAHFKYVHGTASFPDTVISFDGHKRLGTFKAKMTTPRGDINGCIDSVSNGPGQGFVRYTGICETVQLGNVTPINNELCEINFAFAQKKVNGETPKGGVQAAIIADICKQLEEDMPIWEHKVYRRLPILCDGDGPIAKYRKWMQRFYVNYTEK